MAKLEPNQREINGGEHHSVKFGLDEDGYLKLKVDGMCYGTHSFDFEMCLPSIGPEEVVHFSKQLASLAEAMRVIDRNRN